MILLKVKNKRISQRNMKKGKKWKLRIKRGEVEKKGKRNGFPGLR